MKTIQPEYFAQSDELVCNDDNQRSSAASSAAGGPNTSATLGLGADSAILAGRDVCERECVIEALEKQLSNLPNL